MQTTLKEAYRQQPLKPGLAPCISNKTWKLVHELAALLRCPIHTQAEARQLNKP